jgi:hypothetical protein
MVEFLCLAALPLGWKGPVLGVQNSGPAFVFSASSRTTASGFPSIDAFFSQFVPRHGVTVARTVALE